MEFMSIKLKPLESLMLRGSGEFDPSSRGVYSYASSLILPRPSTIVGILISALLSNGVHLLECLSVKDWENLLGKCYIKFLDKLGIEAIRGPYIVKKDKLFTPIMLGKELQLLDYYQAKYLLLEKYGNILEKLFHGKDSVEKIAAILRLIEEDIRNRMREYIIRPRSISWTGIHLKSRKLDEGGKIVEEGYMYTVNYVSYPADVEIIFLLITKNSSSILDYLQDKVAIKFGGEGRIVKMSIEHSSKDNVILSTLSEVEKTKYAILISPMPLKNNELNVSFIGEYAIIGYGYSIAKKRRKPISPSLSEGSILKIDTNKGKLDREKVFRYGLYGGLGLAEDYYYRYIGRLGYASFITLA